MEKIEVKFLTSTKPYIEEKEIQGEIVYIVVIDCYIDKYFSFIKIPFSEKFGAEICIHEFIRKKGE